MKKALYSLVLIVLGSALWYALSGSVRLDIKRWDAALGSALRAGLEHAGVAPADVASSVHRERQDANGRWVSTRMEVQRVSERTVKAVRAALENAGAEVREVREKGAVALKVMQGGREYQDILFHLDASPAPKAR